jgi:hypothetical protein
MSDLQWGVLLMIGAAMFVGTISGFRRSNGRPDDPFKSFPVRTSLAAFVFYYGSLASLPLFLSLSTNDSHPYFGYACLTIALWFGVAMASSFLVMGFFFVFNKFVRWYAKEFPDSGI